MKYRYFAYAMDCASFIIEHTSFGDSIEEVILFGSVSRGEANSKSDVDIFIKVTKESDEIEKDLNYCVEKFYQSKRFREYWQLKNVKLPIKLSIGKIEMWQSLQASITSNGITLYGRYKDQSISGKHEVLFSFENISPQSKRVFLNKKVFGYNQNGKHYEGLLQKYNGTRMGKGTIVVPSEHGDKLLDFFRSQKINVRILKFINYF